MLLKDGCVAGLSAVPASVSSCYQLQPIISRALALIVSSEPDQDEEGKLPIRKKWAAIRMNESVSEPTDIAPTTVINTKERRKIVRKNSCVAVF